MGNNMERQDYYNILLAIDLAIDSVEDDPSNYQKGERENILEDFELLKKKIYKEMDDASVRS